MAWPSSWIFFCLPITAIILILPILAAVWLWTVDDWILCWHKLFYCCLFGNDGMLSFLDSKWHLEFTTFLLHWIVSSRSWSINNSQKCHLIFSGSGLLTFLKIVILPSRHKARFFLLYFWDKLWSKKLPTVSHTPAPSKAPIATSNNQLSFSSKFHFCWTGLIFKKIW